MEKKHTGILFGLFAVFCGSLGPAIFDLIMQPSGIASHLDRTQITVLFLWIATISAWSTDTLMQIIPQPRGRRRKRKRSFDRTHLRKIHRLFGSYGNLFFIGFAGVLHGIKFIVYVTLIMQLSGSETSLGAKLSIPIGIILGLILLKEQLSNVPLFILGMFILTAGIVLFMVSKGMFINEGSSMSWMIYFEIAILTSADAMKDIIKSYLSKYQNERKVRLVAQFTTVSAITVSLFAWYKGVLDISILQQSFSLWLVLIFLGVITITLSSILNFSAFERASHTSVRPLAAFSPAMTLTASLVFGAVGFTIDTSYVNGFFILSMATVIVAIVCILRSIEDG